MIQPVAAVTGSTGDPREERAMPSVEELSRTSLRRFNESDFEGLRSEMGPDFVYDEGGTGRRVTDPDEMIAGLQQWKAALPDVTGSIERLVVPGDTVAMEVVWRGTHSGPLATPTGDFPASGRSVEVWATIWQVWKGGKIASERHHLDLLSMLAQVGALGAQS
jgi:steroid delta-isomerase-like uncharacterized protein